MFPSKHPLMMEKFDFLDHENRHTTWNVDEAKAIIRTTKPRQIHLIPWSNIKETIEKGDDALLLDVDKDLAMRSDLKLPVIMVPYHHDMSTQVMIDGSHRLWKAYKTGSYLLCVFLTLEESKECMTTTTT